MRRKIIVHFQFKPIRGRLSKTVSATVSYVTKNSFGLKTCIQGETMKRTTSSKKMTTLRIARFFIQALAFVIATAGGNAIIRNFGLPLPVYVVTIVLAGMFFCGWACPFGTIQEWLRHIGGNVIGITIRVPSRIDKYLSLSRYVLVAASFFIVFSQYDPRLALGGFFAGRAASVAAYTMLGVILLAALFVERPYCRYLCISGGVHGLMSVLRVATVTRRESVCKQCGVCDASCPMGVNVSGCGAVRDPHCINCFACVANCPVTGALSFGLALPSIRDGIALRKKYSSPDSARTARLEA